MEHYYETRPAYSIQSVVELDKVQKGLAIDREICEFMDLYSPRSIESQHNPNDARQIN